MRVHPNQLSQGLFPLLGPANFWVKSFNLNEKKIVFPICLLFLISVIGSALNKETIGHFKSRLTSLTSKSSISDPLAVVLSNPEGKFLLLSAPLINSSSGDKNPVGIKDLELTVTDRVFLKESEKFGTLSVAPLEEAADFPILKLRSLIELKELLTANTITLPEPSYNIISRVYIPGSSEIYGISDSGKVVEVNSRGQIMELKEY